MIRAVKARLGQQYTISHLGHAAMVLALLQSNPLASSTPPGTALITPLPVNGRRFLKPEFREHRFGSCQAGAVVEFKNLASWAPATQGPGDVQEALGRLSRHVKESYDYWLRNQFQLPLGISKDNFLSAFLSSCVLFSFFHLCRKSLSGSRELTCNAGLPCLLRGLPFR